MGLEIKLIKPWQGLTMDVRTCWRASDPALYREIRELWKAHSIAEDSATSPGSSRP